jgi:hypothetical protein
MRGHRPRLQCLTVGAVYDRAFYQLRRERLDADHKVPVLVVQPEL